MDEKDAKRRAAMMGQLAANIATMAHELNQIGWHVSGQQLSNVRGLLNDVERRLLNGDDIKG